MGSDSIRKYITNSENESFRIEQRKSHLKALLLPVEKPELLRYTQCNVGSMATPWPEVVAWPNDPRENAAYLSDYLDLETRWWSASKIVHTTLLQR